MLFLEAMAAGVPVVATRVGGIPEIVSHGESALLIEPGDATAMKDSLAAVLQDPVLARNLVEHAQQRIRETPLS